MTDLIPYPWSQRTTLNPRSYQCGFCGKNVASNQGYQTDAGAGYSAFIYICHFCNRPSFVFDNEQTPGALFGEDVAYLPGEVDALYREARQCMAVSSYTAAVLVCRKILMNVAVDLRAEQNKSFIQYVQYLADNNYVPPNARGWVDHIRKKGNEANHEILLMSKTDAEELIGLTEMLLKIIYEFPGRVPVASAPPT